MDLLGSFLCNDWWWIPLIMGQSRSPTITPYFMGHTMASGLCFFTSNNLSYWCWVVLCLSQISYFHALVLLHKDYGFDKYLLMDSTTFYPRVWHFEESNLFRTTCNSQIALCSLYLRTKFMNSNVFHLDYSLVDYGCNELWVCHFVLGNSLLLTYGSFLMTSHFVEFDLG